MGTLDTVFAAGIHSLCVLVFDLFQESVPPIIAFHFGSLGFLSPFDFTDYRSKIDQTIAGKNRASTTCYHICRLL